MWTSGASGSQEEHIWIMLLTVQHCFCLSPAPGGTFVYQDSNCFSYVQATEKGVRHTLLLCILCTWIRRLKAAISVAETTLAAAGYLCALIKPSSWFRGTAFRLARQHKSCHSTVSELSLLELHSKDSRSQGFLGRGLVPWHGLRPTAPLVECTLHLPYIHFHWSATRVCPAHLATHLQSYQLRATFLMQSSWEGSDWKMKLS